MTPEREAYLAMCSKRERILRDKIAIFKSALKTSKSFIRNYSTYGTKDSKKMVVMLSGILENKLKLSAYRHELARLKDMYGVCVPKDVTKSYYGKVGRCTCGLYVTENANYCLRCGRKLLWEKVKF